MPSFGRLTAIFKMLLLITGGLPGEKIFNNIVYKLIDNNQFRSK